MEPPLLRRDLEFAAQDKAYQSLLTANMNPGVQPLTYIQYQGLEVKRQMFKEKWAEFFEDWDVLLCPVMPTSAFPHDHDMSRKSHDYCWYLGCNLPRVQAMIVRTGGGINRRLIVNGEETPYFDHV